MGTKPIDNDGMIYMCTYKPFVIIKNSFITFKFYLKSFKFKPSIYFNPSPNI